MDFRTKLDFSTRQVKQKTKVMADLSGSTKFGVPFNTIPTGPDLSKSGVTAYYMSFNSSFSGNSLTTMYNWAYPIMSSGEYQLSALTPSNSADTQTVLSFSSTSSTIIDGNFVNLSYSGITFDITPVLFNDLGSGNYSGTVYTELLEILSAEPLDFTGRTIWVDVSGMTRTNQLIVTKNANIGKVLTCIDSEGMTEWQTLSGLTALTSVWSAGTGTPSAILANSGGIASGQYSVASGFGSSSTGFSSTAFGTYAKAYGSNSFASGNNARASATSSVAFGNNSIATGQYSFAAGDSSCAAGYGAHALMSNNVSSGDYSFTAGENCISSGRTSFSMGLFCIAGGNYSHAIGGYTTAIGNYSHAEGAGSDASGSWSHAEGANTQAIGDYSHAEGNHTQAIGDSSHAEGSGSQAIGLASHAEGSGSRAIGDYSHSQGFSTSAMTTYSFVGGYNTISQGFASFVYGTGSTVSGNHSIVLGRDITGATNDTTYVDQLNIKTVGAGPGVTDIGIDAMGNVVDQASDLSLKENINTINSALDKLIKLRGVTYNWKNREKGGNALKLGFIAQEVNEIIPELTYNNGQYMGVHYKDISALLVEAIKELYQNKTIVNNSTHIESETIVAEDNNIDLNYNGNHESSIGGGLTVLNGISDGENTEFKTDENGDWLTNVNIIPKGLIIPKYTPESSNSNGKIGSITYDENFLYIKTENGWKRTSLESF
jgi:hypothetical protein